MNESLRDEFIYAGKKWEEYDGTFLEFPKDSDARPQKRFLYFHYWMCLIKAYRELTAGWQNVRDKTKIGRLWSTPGKRHSFRSIAYFKTILQLQDSAFRVKTNSERRLSSRSHG
jgi:hypothetical protein